MVILINDPEAGAIPHRARLLIPLLRRLDPFLYLSVGIITTRGRELSRRLEVWRHCEDGKDRLIGRWKFEQVDSILADLHSMNPAARNHVSTVARVEADNADLLRAGARELREVLAEYRDHFLFTAHRYHHRRRSHSFADTTRNRSLATAKKWSLRDS